MRMNPRAVVASLVSIGAFLAAAPAVAQGEQCSWLQSQYANALRQGGGALDAGRRLAQAQAAAERMNCSGGFLFFFGPGPAPGCGAVMANIRRLQADLGRGSFGGGSFQPDLQSLRDELRYNGCSVPEASYGRARTICVRACDGYYFPINSSSPRSRWKVDAEACQSMYGAADQAELYISNADGDVADAKSLTGKRYGDQPFAFNYRVTHSEACASQLKQGIAALGIRYLAARERARPAQKSRQPQVSSLVPLPRLRPADLEDPETIANRTGEFIPREVADEPVRAVRQIGPEYYAEMHSLAKPLASSQSWSWPAVSAYAEEAPRQAQPSAQ
jgi:hypothetical protein